MYRCEKAMVIEVHEQQDLVAAAEMLKAVAHPARMALIQALDGGARKNVTELFGEVGLEQAAASHHLSLLRDRGVLLQEREGKHVYYSLRHPRLIEIVRCVRECCEVAA
jgi:DNA-binding transcriptional ArsR family regulator